MEEPGARVIALEGDHKPAISRQHGSVASGWVAEVESGPIGCIIVPPGTDGEGICYSWGAAKDQEVVSL